VRFSNFSSLMSRIRWRGGRRRRTIGVELIVKGGVHGHGTETSESTQAFSRLQ
jgi:hypothetical protein